MRRFSRSPLSGAIVILATVALSAACSSGAAPSAPPTAPPPAAAPSAPSAVAAAASPPTASPVAGASPAAGAAASTYSPAAVQALVNGAKNESVLKGAWSASSFGGSAGMQRLVDGMNRKYGLQITPQFTPGIDEQAMATQLAQQAAAGQPPTEDVYLGNPAGVHDVESMGVFVPIDWRSIVDRPLVADPDFDPVVTGNIAIAFASSVIGVSYNSNLVQPADVPHKLADLLAPKWKGKIASTPYASGFRELAFPEMLGATATTDYARQFAPQVAGLIRCGESDRLTSGEFIMLAFDCGANDVITLKRQGAPVDHAVLDDAAVVHNRYGAVPKNSQAPNAAALFIAYLETPEAQAILWDVDGLDLYTFTDGNIHQVTQGVRDSGNRLTVDSPQWLDSYPDFSAVQKQLGDILARGS